MSNIFIFIVLLFTQEQTPIFESDCDDLSIWEGGIQGVERSKKSYPYKMAECHSNLHYDLIWTKSETEQQTCFAFVIPKVEPSEPENEFDIYDYVFPSDVKIYRKNAATWQLISTERVGSFEQLGELKLKTVTKK